MKKNRKEFDGLKRIGYKRSGKPAKQNKIENRKTKSYENIQ